MKLQKLTKAWFDFPNDSDESSFEIKHLLAGEISEIVEKTHSRRFEFREDKKGKLIPVPILETKDLLERELTIIAVVTAWNNFFDPDGKPLDCTNENKLRLCKELNEEDFKIFMDFITDCRQKLADIVKEESKAEKKT